MDASEHEWRTRLVQAAESAADELRAADPHYHRPLIEDLEALSARLTGELDEPPPVTRATG